MTATTIALGPMSEVEHQSALRRAVIASTVGTTIEWYDFLIYSTVTGLVFNKVYFPGSDPWIGTLQAFGVYFIGFVARPIGAVIFGHYGDRIGRKATLIVTLLMTGIATAAVGLVPGYDTIGIWGAVILTLLRLIQGIGVGGEWGGSVLLAMEWAQTNKNRGFITSWPQFGAPAGLFLANVAVLFFSWYSGDQFLNWGWRIPFLMSIIMVAVGLWIRLGILETPVFQRILAENKVERAPIIEVLKRQPREVILSALLRMAEQTPGYIFNAFVLTYGTLVVGASRDLLLLGTGRHDRARLHHGPDRRRLVGSHRPPEGLHWRLRLGCGVHLRLFRAARHQGAGAHFPRRGALVHSGDDHVRPGSRADRGGVHAAAALQRRLDWLSARLDHCRRTGAVHLDLAVLDLSFRVPDRPLRLRLRGDQHLRGLAAPRPDQQGHCARGELRQRVSLADFSAASRPHDLMKRTSRRQCLPVVSA